MTLKTTPLDALHRRLGARMVPFAGYDMPVQFPEGIIAEHRHTREAAGLFDVSHMGQFLLRGRGIAESLEALMPVDLESLDGHRQCYALLMNDEGGVRDDLIVTRWDEETFFLVVNAACKDDDREWIASQLRGRQTLEEMHERALLALQGPRAREVLDALLPGAASLVFMSGGVFTFEDTPIYVTCSGYTGEDGFELSCPASIAELLAERLLASPPVKPIGLGARDSLRLEAGLCLYGHELSPTITPVEAGVTWSISKSRRPGGTRAGGYPGAPRIELELAEPPARKRVGLRVDGRRPAREGQAVLSQDGEQVGVVTSGAFGASVEAPIAMALVERAHASPDTRLAVDVRGKPLPVTVCRTPFVPQRYFRG